MVIQLESLERHPYRAATAENPAGSELSALPEVLEILQRNKDWAIREGDRRAYGREEQKPAKVLTNRPAWGTKRRTWNGRCCAGKCTGRLRQDRTPETDAGEREGEESGLRGEDKGTQRVDSKGSGECDRKAGHRVDRGGITDNYEVAKKQPRRWFQVDDDDERCKRREKPEETALRRQTRKGRTR